MNANKMLNLAKESTKRGYSLGRPLAGEVFNATGSPRFGARLSAKLWEAGYARGCLFSEKLLKTTMPAMLIL